MTKQPQSESSRSSIRKQYAELITRISLEGEEDPAPRLVPSATAGSLARGRSEPPRNADHPATQILPSSSPQSGRSQRPLFVLREGLRPPRQKVEQRRPAGQR